MMGLWRKLQKFSKILKSSEINFQNQTIPSSEHPIFFHSYQQQLEWIPYETHLSKNFHPSPMPRNAFSLQPLIPAHLYHQHQNLMP